VVGLSSGEKLLNRKFAALAVATGIIFGTTGCSYMVPITSMQAYTPGDGTSTDFGNIAARNIFILVTPSNQYALFGSFINTGTSASGFGLELAGQTYNLNLQPGEKLDFGFNGKNALPLSALTDAAGSLADVKFSNGATTIDETLPVLDATFAQYAPLVNSIGIIAPTEAPE
jgi:hypothetical protein